jgi:hypothetical protein
VVSSPFVLRTRPLDVLGVGMFTPLARMHFANLLSACLRPSARGRCPPREVGRTGTPAGGFGAVDGAVDVRPGAAGALPGAAGALPGEVEVCRGVVGAGVDVTPAVFSVGLAAAALLVDVPSELPHAARERQASSTADTTAPARIAGLNLLLMRGTKLLCR